ncbi:MAG: translation initiation factor IF-6 [Candidatus Micrarchaeota archaeon]
MSFKISKTSIQKNPFIGLFTVTNNEYTLIPKASPHDFEKTVAETLGTEIVHVLINESGLIGLFAAMNAKGVVLPSFAENKDVQQLKKLGLNVLTLDKAYAAGNVLLTNDKTTLASIEMPRESLKNIADCLGTEVIQHPIAGVTTIGSHNVVTNKGMLAHNDTSEVDLKYLQKIFKVPVLVGSTNMGAGGNSLGITANDKGAIVGSLTTGFETQRIYEILSE